MQKIRRCFAILMIIAILGLVIWACILGIMGSRYFPAALLLCVIVPVLFYGISLVTRLLTAKGKEMAEEAKNKTSKEQAKNKTENSVEK